MATHVYRRPPDPLQRFRLATVPIFFSEPLGAISGTATLSFSETAVPSPLVAAAGAATIAFSETGAPGVYANTYGGRRNKLLYSNDFTNARWTKDKATLVVSAETPPVGISQCYELRTTTDNAQHRLRYIDVGLPQSAVTEAFSFYLKVAPGSSYDGVLFQTFGDGNHQRIGFDISTGLQELQNSPTWDSYSVTGPDANGWRRYDVRTNSRGSSQDYIDVIINDDALNSGIFVGDGTGILIAAGQCEERDAATDFILQTDTILPQPDLHLIFSEVGGLDASVIYDIAGAATIEFSETALLDAFAFGDMSASEQIIFSHFAKLSDASTELPQPILPVLKPAFRTIDAKTLADHFNRGQAQTPDYDWPNRRRFYQDDA